MNPTFKLFLTALIITALPAWSQLKQWDNQLSIEENIAQNAIAADQLQEMYCLAITSLTPDGVANGELELAIAQSIQSKPYAFIDFTPLRYADNYRNKEFDCAVVGGKKKGKFMYIFDGIYFLRKQELKEITSQF